MKTLAAVVAAMIISGVLGGCVTPQEIPGRSRVLGEVKYEDAFAAAKGIISKHFAIASADPDSGEIKCEPKYLTTDRGERILGNSPARQLAVMRVQQSGKLVNVKLSIALQRQGEDVNRVMSPVGDNYSGVPNQTPAQMAGATDPEQNSNWRTERYVHDMETRILDELYTALRPQAVSQPASQSVGK